MGIVNVDGDAAELVEVTCHPEPGTSEIKYDITAMTDAEGVFHLNTYEGNDGLPIGTYSLGFKFIEPGLVAKDKFKGKYANPAKSDHKITIEGIPEEKIDLGTIELTSKK